MTPAKSPTLTKAALDFREGHIWLDADGELMLSAGYVVATAEGESLSMQFEGPVLSLLVKEDADTGKAFLAALETGLRRLEGLEK